MMDMKPGHLLRIWNLFAAVLSDITRPLLYHTSTKMVMLGVGWNSMRVRKRTGWRMRHRRVKMRRGRRSESEKRDVCKWMGETDWGEEVSTDILRRNTEQGNRWSWSVLFFQQLPSVNQILDQVCVVHWSVKVVFIWHSEQHLSNIPEESYSNMWQVTYWRRKWVIWLVLSSMWSFWKLVVQLSFDELYLYCLYSVSCFTSRYTSAVLTCYKYLPNAEGGDSWWQ